MVKKSLEGELVVKIDKRTISTTIGRPSKLTAEVIEKAWDWLNTTSTVSRGQLLPTIEGLALALGTHRGTLQEWEKENKEFSIIMDKLRSAQAEKLIQNALTGNYNPTIAKLLLSKHGYVERTEQDVKVEAVQPILGGEAKRIEDSNEINN